MPDNQQTPLWSETPPAPPRWLDGDEARHSSLGVVVVLSGERTGLGWTYRVVQAGRRGVFAVSGVYLS